MGVKKKSDSNTSEDLEETEFHSVEDVIQLLDNIKKELKATKANTPPKLPELLLGLTSAVATLVEKLK